MLRGRMDEWMEERRKAGGGGSTRRARTVRQTDGTARRWETWGSYRAKLARLQNAVIDAAPHSGNPPPAREVGISRAGSAAGLDLPAWAML